MRKRTEAYAAAVKMAKRPYYRILRRHEYGIKEAMEEVRKLDTVLLTIEATTPEDKKTCET